MKNFLLASLALCVAATATADPVSNRAVNVPGVTAYQDNSDKLQWHFVPSRTDLAPNFGITSFSVRYWGFGPRWMECPGGNTSNCYSAVGAVLGGQIVIDMSPSQRRQLVKAIAASSNGTIKEGDIKLKPATLRNVSVEPVIAQNTLAFGSNSDVKFPKTLQLASTVNYTVGTGGSTFAAVLASGDPDSWEVTPNPLFGLNIAAGMEVIGEPWSGKVRCDLSKVWDEVRTSGGGSVGYGWFSLGLSYSEVIRKLETSGACSFEFVEGSMDTSKYGVQMFDLLKDIFAAINEKAQAGQGFFKFEPVPDEQGGGRSLLRGWSPWSVSINASYAHNHFKQTIAWETSFSYQGRFEMPVFIGVTLALTCSQATKHMFADVADSSQPCLTKAKTDEFNRRAALELAAKERATQDLYNRLANGNITETQYEKLVALLAKMSFTEGTMRLEDLRSGFDAAGATWDAMVLRELLRKADDEAPDR